MASQQERWQVAGTGAAIYQEHLVPAIFGPWAPVLVDLAAPGPGERVLDVACGTGIVARAAAARVGPTGRVVGIDLNPGMLDVARAFPPLAGATIEWQEGDAGALPFADAAFEVVLCQLGLQYFPDRSAALREMQRVLVAGGRLALLVWQAIDQSPGFALLAEALERRVGAEAAATMRAPFVLGDPEQVQALIAGAGFRDVAIRAAVGTVRFASAEDLLRYFVVGSPLAGPVGQASDEARAALASEFTTAVRPYVGSEGLAFPIGAYLATGHT